MTIYTGSDIRMKFWLLIQKLGEITGSDILFFRGKRNVEYNRNLNAQRILINNGIIIKGSIEIGPEVDLTRIEKGVILEHGVKIFGSKTLFREGSTFDDGTYTDIITGKDVHLGKGSYHDSVFLDKSEVRYGAEIRKGTLFEEGANTGHLVGTKMTILGSFVCLGSSINFCDIIDIGGSAVCKEDFLAFNEIGSGVIHYNFTPYGDKYSSYIGAKVCDAVFINTKKTFLGGQARLIAPNIVDEGVVVAAGCDLRKGVKPGKILLTEGVSSTRVERNFDARVYGLISDKLRRTIYIIANLKTLIEWYKKVRLKTIANDPLQEEIYNSAIYQMERHIKERIYWLNNLCINKLPLSIKLLKEKTSEEPLEKERIREIRKKIFDQELTINAWEKVKQLFNVDSSEFFEQESESDFVKNAIPVIKKEIENGGLFITGVKKLPQDIVEKGRIWLAEGFNKFLTIGYRAF